MGRTGPAVTARVLTTYRKASNPPGNGALADLTARELDVLTLIATGRSNAEIADELFISAFTDKSHTGRIFVNSICATALPRSSTRTTTESSRRDRPQ